MVQALDPNLWVLLQHLRLLATAIALEAVDRPIAIGGKIDLPITALIRQGQKCFKTGGFPETISTVPVLGTVI